MSPALRVALVAAMVGVVVIGVYPQPFIVLAQKLFPASVTTPAALKAPAPSPIEGQP